MKKAKIKKEWFIKKGNVFYYKYGKKVIRMGFFWQTIAVYHSTKDDYNYQYDYQIVSEEATYNFTKRGIQMFFSKIVAYEWLYMADLYASYYKDCNKAKRYFQWGINILTKNDTILKINPDNIDCKNIEIWCEDLKKIEKERNYKHIQKKNIKEEIK